MIGDRKIADQAGRDRPPAGLDAPCFVQKQDRAASQREIVGGGGAGGTAAVARVFTATHPSAQVVSAIRACPHVLGVTVSQLRR